MTEGGTPAAPGEDRPEDPPPEGEPQPKGPAATDEELELESKRVDLDRRYAEVEREREKLHTDRANRTLREFFANGALVVMVAQIVAANAIFIWYGDTNGWDIPGVAISAWLGATVIQVVAVVLVIMNYLFPRGGPPNA